MKKIISCAAIAALTLGSGYSAVAQQQGQAGQATSAAAVPCKVALIDMAHVFQNYDKFKALREDLKSEIERVDAEAKQKTQQLAALQQELKKLSETGFSETSPEYIAKEKQLASGAAEFESSRKLLQREFLRKEAELYKQVYLETTDMVKRYAAKEGYTLVLRFQRENVDTTQGPQETLQLMNKQVVYHQEQDDITEKVTYALNYYYKQAAGGAASPAPKAAAGTTGTTRN